MRPEEEFREALALVSEGANDSEIARRLGIPRTTIRDWRRAAAQNPGHRTVRATGARAAGPVESTNPGGPCTGSCGAPAFALRDRGAYFYLLGQYLGDGSISAHPRGVFRLRIACADDYPNIMREVGDAMSTVAGGRSVHIVAGAGCSYVSCYWKHWPCVFPQHGTGRKHGRSITLAAWQHPGPKSDHQSLVRGLIQSDGCRFSNPVRRRLTTGWKSYRYPRYVFTNHSDDIKKIFTSSLDALCINWRTMTRHDISIARAESVRALDEFVGPKS